MKQRVIGQLCVGPGEGDRYLAEILEDKSRFCDVIIVLGDGPIDEKTRKVAKSFPKVKYFQLKESIFHTKQWMLKQTAQQLAIKEKPDWILAFDADDLFEKALTPKKFQELIAHEDPSWMFRYVHLWGDREHYRVDKFWKMNKPILYRYNPDVSQMFKPTPLHTGLVPKAYYKYASSSPYIVEHLGYMDPKDMPLKIARYKKYDPESKYTAEGYYESMKAKAHVELYDPEKIRHPLEHNKQLAWTEEQNKKNDLTRKDVIETYLVENLTGKRVQIPASLLDQVKQAGFKILSKVDVGAPLSPEIEVAELMDDSGFVCEYCGQVCKSAAGLKAHIRGKHKKKQKSA